MRSRLLLLLVLVATPLAAQQAARDVPTAWARAANAGDTSALMRLYASDRSVTTVGGGRLVRGPAAVRSEVVGIVERGRGLLLVIDSISVERDAASWALVTARWRVRQRSGAPRMAGGIVSMALVRSSATGPWRILHDHWSMAPDDTPPAAAAPPVATPLPDSGPRPPRGERSECRLTRVTDGDSIECEGTGKVRLIGIDTPELSQAPFGTEARDALAAMLERGRRIELERDVELRDRYQRMLAYVWVDGRMANWLMARSGYAVQITVPPNVRYAERFSEAVTAARREVRGLWATGGFSCEPAARRDGKC